MLNSNISTDLLELKDVNIDSVENYSDLKVIKCHLESKEDRICPRCGSKHVHIHDHRTVYLKDVDMAGKQVVLNLKRKDTNARIVKRFIQRITKYIPNVTVPPADLSAVFWIALERLCQPHILQERIISQQRLH